MCGIAGILSPYPSLVQPKKVQAMADALQHRGPDGEGFWANEENTICLGHRRLAIIDTSNAAAQPFNYLHYTLVFNGEIYNYIEIKQTLHQHGYSFTTLSDSEVIPAAFDHWGKDCLHHFDGMFAFALYDANTKELWIARDRFGEKPLYYHAIYQQRGQFEQFAFASEMKALWAIGIEKQLSGTMMLNYLTLGYTQNPIKQTQTFYSNILSLPAGHYLTIQPSKGKVQMKKWYSLSGQWSVASGQLGGSYPPSGVRGISYPPLGDGGDAIELFTELFNTSIKRRLRSDVPLGTSLSGGLDSSAIAATLLSSGVGSLDTFSAVFPGFKQDESQFIDDFQQRYPQKNLHCHFVTPTTQDWIDNWGLLMHHQEEPVQSSSILTQFMVYKLAKEQGITVLLDGQGADEVLGGYKKYMPWFLQQQLRSGYANFAREKRLLQQNDFLDSLGIKNYAAAFFPERAAKQLQQNAIIRQKHNAFINPDFYNHYQNKDTLQKPVVKTLEDILYYNTFTQGLQELVRYADRNSMAHSREVRLPFLSHQLVEFIFSLPATFKVRDGFTKWILRKSVEGILPASIAWRKGKVGYEPPQQQWMQQPAIIDMVHESRKKLVAKNILTQAALNAPLNAKAAHAADNFDWRYMSAAGIL
ncbi:asparagine synthase (glutamine-hydrolyzing) [Parasediminibacterium sp. JCM 36343]|uniref:asparagine synthase (glutamine-hydrolyzing) n=1 Tax=Parasediminibacterium sp. JCM 36343 TaxID=3374279 RepID=UPI00397E9162